jgi:hypothetical protein
MVAFGLYALIRVLQNLVALAGGARVDSIRSALNPSEEPAKPGISLTHWKWFGSEILAWFLTQLSSTNILYLQGPTFVIWPWCYPLLPRNLIPVMPLKTNFLGTRPGDQWGVMDPRLDGSTFNWPIWKQDQKLWSLLRMRHLHWAGHESVPVIH